MRAGGRRQDSNLYRLAPEDFSPLASTQSNEVICRRRRRDTCPAAFHYLSTTGEDSWGLQGTHGDNELHRNPLPFFDLATKVVRRQRFSKRAG